MMPREAYEQKIELRGLVERGLMTKVEATESQPKGREDGQRASGRTVTCRLRLGL